MSQNWYANLTPGDWRPGDPDIPRLTSGGQVKVMTWAEQRSWIWMTGALIFAAIIVLGSVFGISWLGWAVLPAMLCLRQEGYWSGWRNGWSAR